MEISDRDELLGYWDGWVFEHAFNCNFVGVRDTAAVRPPKNGGGNKLPNRDYTAIHVTDNGARGNSSDVTKDTP